MRIIITSIVCTLIVLIGGCASKPKRQCYEMTIGFGYNGPQSQRICTTTPQKESVFMRKVP